MHQPMAAISTFTAVSPYALWWARKHRLHRRQSAGNRSATKPGSRPTKPGPRAMKHDPMLPPADARRPAAGPVTDKRRSCRARPAKAGAPIPVRRFRHAIAARIGGHPRCRSTNSVQAVHCLGECRSHRMVAGTNRQVARSVRGLFRSCRRRAPAAQNPFDARPVLQHQRRNLPESLPITKKEK